MQTKCALFKGFILTRVRTQWENAHTHVKSGQFWAYRAHALRLKINYDNCKQQHEYKINIPCRYFGEQLCRGRGLNFSLNRISTLVNLRKISLKIQALTSDLIQLGALYITCRCKIGRAIVQLFVFIVVKTEQVPQLCGFY